MPAVEPAQAAVGHQRVIIVGGGAAGFFAGITCAADCPTARITVLEKGAHFLSKVRISGGGRCNVTHACFDPRELSTFYPRGGAALLGPFQRFQPRDTVEWFERRGVRLKTESDGRIFPMTDSSQTIIDCLMQSARGAGVELLTSREVGAVRLQEGGGFVLQTASGARLECARLMLATGGCRAPSAGGMAVALGHTLEPPVPSLFTFEIRAPWLNELAGITIEAAELFVPGTKLRERGPVLITHTGLSGPAVLRASAWGARVLHGLNYNFALRVNWAPQFIQERWVELFQERRARHGSRLLVNSPVAPLPARLWQGLVGLAGIPREIQWAALSRSAQQRLIQQLTSTELRVTGKSLNRDEFVTCGGVRLREVNFQRMESRICPGLFFGGELLDIDGLTGGFNFQAAWTTGWIAGRAMAESLR